MLFQPWNLVFLIGFAIYVTIRGVFQERVKRAEREVMLRRVDALDRALLGLVLVGNMLLPVVYLFTSWLEFADVRLPAAAHWIGAVAMAAALWLFWRAHADLGANWSPMLEVRKGHELVRRGVYRSIRHPMYASFLLFGLAQGLLLDNRLAGWAALATCAALYVGRVGREERLMCEHFGAAYREYMDGTGRLWPRSLRRQP